MSGRLGNQSLFWRVTSRSTRPCPLLETQELPPAGVAVTFTFASTATSRSHKNGASRNNAQRNQRSFKFRWVAFIRVNLPLQQVQAVNGIQRMQGKWRAASTLPWPRYHPPRRYATCRNFDQR